MNPFATLMEKPWLSHGAGAELPSQPAIDSAGARTALGFLLAVVAVIFLLFTVTFLPRSQYPDFQALAGAPWLPLSNPTQLWFNTAALLLASLALRLARRLLARQRIAAAWTSLLAGGALCLLFLLGQLWLWRQLVDLGYYLAGNPANSYFYLYTGAHGLHLLGGLLALAYVCGHYLRAPSSPRFALGLQLCSRYWDFLLLLWLFLFALLTRTPEQFAAIAQFCGY